MKANEIMERLFTLALKDREFNPNGDTNDYILYCLNYT